MKSESKLERALRKYYSFGVCSGLSKVFTPREVRDKMTVHAERGMKVLVLFNHEFCSDLHEKGIKDVTFASDDELKNSIVEGVWGYPSELIEARTIKEKFKGMKFDLIISNPPYNNNIDLQILSSILPLSDKICFVHPAGFLLDNKNTYAKIRSEIKTRLKKIDLFNGNDIFGITLKMPCSITLIESLSDKIHYTDSSLFFNKSSFSIELDDIEKIDKYCWYPKYFDLKNKIRNYTHKLPQENLEATETSLSTAIISGISGGRWLPDKSTVIYTTIPKKGMKIFGWHFESLLSRDNFIIFTKTKLARFCYSIVKISQSNHRGEFLFLPWLDFSKSWTDETVAKELGITDEELLWIIDQIPDYYPEDKEKYELLKSKLMHGKIN